MPPRTIYKGGREGDGGGSLAEAVRHPADEVAAVAAGEGSPSRPVQAPQTRPFAGHPAGWAVGRLEQVPVRPAGAVSHSHGAGQPDWQTSKHSQARQERGGELTIFWRLPLEPATAKPATGVPGVPLDDTGNEQVLARKRTHHYEKDCEENRNIPFSSLFVMNNDSIFVFVTNEFFIVC